MTNQHPITPPPELVGQWSETIYQQTEQDDERDLYIANQAARWGAKQELEACCEWLIKHGYDIASPELRTSRRPKPPSLKEQALRALEDDDIDVYLIRRALEALPND